MGRIAPRERGRGPRRGASLLLAACLAGCAAQAPDPPDLLAPPDARTPDVAADQGTAPMDVAPDAGAEDAASDVLRDVAPDVAMATDTGREDTGVAPDAPRPCTPTRTSCNMTLECGAIPNGCPGGVFRCGDCGGGEVWCAIRASRWQTRVYNCVQRAQSEHSEWFDPTMFRDTSSWLVLEAHARSYVAEVARCTDSGGGVAVVDALQPEREVRVRGADDDVAENFIVRTYGTGRTAARYTSACTPAMF